MNDIGPAAAGVAQGERLSLENFVGVDWGTSSLRVALLDAEGAVREERSSDRGILSVPAGAFPEVLRETCGDWLAAPRTLCLVSGMAGSRQGWQEARYCNVPVGFRELARAVTWIEPHRIGLVPGLAFEFLGTPDVLRGEEVQVFGAMDLLQLNEGMFVLPGTHCKWVRVAEGRITSFSTFMSGEFYGLLRQHSILARTLPAEDGPFDEPAFLRGVHYAQQARSLLHGAFSARTLALFDRLTPAALPSYLSGLVIGEELRGRALHGTEVVVIGNPVLTAQYALALRALGCASRSLGAQATWRGLWALARILVQS